MSAWYVQAGDEPAGPYSEEEIRAELTAGRLTLDHLLWQEGWPEWRRLSEIEELSVPPAAPKAPAPVVAPAPVQAARPAAAAKQEKPTPEKKSRRRWLWLLLLLLLLALIWFLWPRPAPPPGASAPGAPGAAPLPGAAPTETAVVAGRSPVAVARLTFLGAAGQVSGSCHLLELPDARMLVDAGIFYEDPVTGRGVGPERERELYDTFPIPPTALDFLLLTHAHLDHIGRLPYLFALGARPRIICTPPTRDILLMTLRENLRSMDLPGDQLTREQGGRVYHLFADQCPIARAIPAAKRERLAGGRQRAMEQRLELCNWCLDAELAEMEGRIEPTGFNQPVKLTERLTIELFPAAHMLGACWAKITYALTPDTPLIIAFSGDQGDNRDPFFPRKLVAMKSDYALIESTYGGSVTENPTVDPWQEFLPFLQDVKAAVEKKQLVLIPAFVTDRAHKVLAVLQWGRERGLIPRSVPIYLTSPTASTLIEVYGRHAGRTSPFYTDTWIRIANSLKDGTPFAPAGLLRKTEKQYPLPSIVVAHSAMMEHGEAYRLADMMIDDPRLKIIFVGYQAPYTPGGRIKDEEATTVTLGGRERTIRAERVSYPVFSGHADRNALMEWVRSVSPARGLFVVHGEKKASAAVATAARADSGGAAQVIVPAFCQSCWLTTDKVSETMPLAPLTVKPLPPRLSSGLSGEDAGVSVTAMEGGNVTIADGLTLVGVKNASGVVTWPGMLAFLDATVESRLKRQASGRRTGSSLPLVITRVALAQNEGGGSTLAIASVDFNNALRLNGVRLMRKADGTAFASGPSERSGSVWKDKVKFSRQIEEMLRMRIQDELKKRPGSAAPGAPASGGARFKVTALSDDKVTLGNGLVIRRVKRSGGTVTWPECVEFRDAATREAVTSQVSNHSAQSSSPSLKITDYDVRKVNKGNLIAYADVEFNGAVLITGIKLLRGKEGDVWLAMPAEQVGGEWVDLVELPKALKDELTRRLKAAVK